LFATAVSGIYLIYDMIAVFIVFLLLLFRPSVIFLILDAHHDTVHIFCVLTLCDYALSYYSFCSRGNSFFMLLKQRRHKKVI